MKTSIRYKILPILIIGILALSGVFFYVLIQKVNGDFTRSNMYQIQTSKKSFDSLKDEETKILKLAVTDAVNNDQIKSAYLSKDRKTLLATTKDLFVKQKAETGVTNWVFHDADAWTVFLRVHSPDLFGKASSQRIVVAKAAASGSWGTGLETGERGFALRVAYPFKDQETLIGFVEYGVEVNPFLTIMKAETGDDFLIVSKKSTVPADKWASWRTSKGLRNNYDDMPNYVVTGTTNEFFTQSNKCFNEEQLNLASTEGNVFGQFSEGGKTYLCGGFTIVDASDKPAGVVVVARDITADIANTAATTQLFVIIGLISVIVISLIVVIFVNFTIIAPLKKLTDAAKEVGDGNIDADLPKINSNDELKDLSDAIETIVGAVKFLKGKEGKGKK